jgi:hypothetical protein
MTPYLQHQGAAPPWPPTSCPHLPAPSEPDMLYGMVDTSGIWMVYLSVGGLTM